MRLLVRTPNWLGDVVMALPALAALRAHFPRAALSAAAPRPLAPLLAAAPGVDEVVGLTRGGPGGRRSEAEALRRGAFDVVVLLPGSFGSAWTARRAGIPERWGFAGTTSKGDSSIRMQATACMLSTPANSRLTPMRRAASEALKAVAVMIRTARAL